MKSTIILGAFLASVAIAQPHKQHKHAARHQRAVEKRDGQTTVITTEWVYETEIVDYTETIWVTPGFVAPDATTTTSVAPSTTSTTPTPTSTSSAISQSAAQFFEPQSTSSTQAPAPAPTTESSTPVYVAPTTSSVYVAPVVESSSSVYVAPVVVPTTTEAAVVYTPPVETTTSAAPVATAAQAVSGSSSSSSSSLLCNSGSPCSGDITYYEAGLGACGWTNDGSVEKIVALPYGLMGTQSNGNPYCGKTITVSYGGKTTTALVADKCMGCTGDSIDLSNAAFEELAELAVGRTQAEWWFN